jgi:hypothetical protein
MQIERRALLGGGFVALDIFFRDAVQMIRELYADNLRKRELRRDQQGSTFARSHVHEHVPVWLQRNRAENLVDHRGRRRHVEVNRCLLVPLKYGH